MAFTQQQIQAEIQRRKSGDTPVSNSFTPEQVQAEIQRRGIQLPQKESPPIDNQSNTLQDVGVSTLTGLAELPLGLQQRATALAETLGAKTAGIPSLAMGFLADPAEVLSNPELRKQLMQTDIGQLREAQSGAAQRIEELQREAEETSPIAAPVGEIGAQIAQLAPIGGVARTIPKAAAVGGAVGGGVGLLQPETEILSGQEELVQAGKSGLTGSALGGIAGAGFQKLAKEAPAIANKIATLSEQVPVNITRGFSKLFKINPQAASDLADANVVKSLAAVSDSPTIKLFDKWLSTFPTAASIIGKNTEKALSGIKKQLDVIGAAKGVTKQEAGEALQKGIGNFTKRFDNVSNKLYGVLDRHVAPNTMVNVSNSIKLMNDKVAATAATPKLQARELGLSAAKTLKDLVDDAARS